MVENLEVGKMLDIAKVVCGKVGHEYANAMVHFNRDEQGVAFSGNGQRTAAKHMIYVCRKCGGTIEIEVAPVLEFRLGLPGKPMPGSQKGIGTVPPVKI